MLRTALIGSPATGKTTLFRLMTEAHEAPRATHGKLEAALGIARVPDPRLDVLTAMYKPRKRVPATVEFADIPGRPTGTGAVALLDVAAYRNADAGSVVTKDVPPRRIVLGSPARDLREVPGEQRLENQGWDLDR